MEVAHRPHTWARREGQSGPGGVPVSKAEASSVPSPPVGLPAAAALLSRSERGDRRLHSGDDRAGKGGGLGHVSPETKMESAGSKRREEPH